MGQGNSILQNDFNPTFLFTWKGIRTKDEEKYHNHEFLELCYVQSGKGMHKLDGKLYEVQEGDLLIINAGVFHQSLTGDPKAPMAEFYVGLNDLQLAGLEPNCLPLKDGCPVIHTAGDLKLKVSRLCLSMDLEKETCRVGRYYMMKSYAVQMLLLLLREQQPQQKKSSCCCSFESVNRKYLVERIVDYFEEHYEQKISLDQIAENMYLSPFYISKIFKAETGNTPIHYLIDIRMEKAREFLSTRQELSIQEVALRVGYEDAYHFSKLFKKKFGISPSAARRLGSRS